jgi:hypothetical protein
MENVACNRLAEFYAKGLGDTTRDLQQAEKYARRSDSADSCFKCIQTGEVYPMYDEKIFQ